MMADELLNAQDLITAKKHDTFHSEVITGKAGGLSTGANIDHATNAVTGQVQKTLPKILDDLDWSYVGLFADGVTFTDKTDFAVDAVGTQWIYTGSLPFTATAGTVPSEPLYQAVRVNSLQQLSGLTEPSDLDQVHTRTFANVDAMLAFNGLVEGQAVRTLGGVDTGDGEGADYLIQSSGEGIPISGGLVAIKQGENYGYQTDSYDQYKAGARKKMDIFVIYGQSNSVGFAGGVSSPGRVDPLEGTFRWDGTNIVAPSYTQKSSSGESSTGHAWISFGNRYKQLSGRNVLIVPCGKGATSIVQLSKGTSYYTSMLAWAQDAIAAVNASDEYELGIVSVCYHQGETDMLNLNSRDAYQTSFDTLSGNMRADIPCDFFFNFLVGNPQNREERSIQAIQNAQKYVARNNVATYTAFDGCPKFTQANGLLGPDGVHYSQRGYNMMGEEGARNVYDVLRGFQGSVGRKLTLTNQDLNKFAQQSEPADQEWLSVKAAAVVNSGSFVLRSNDYTDPTIRLSNVTSISLSAERVRFNLACRANRVLKLQAYLNSSGVAQGFYAAATTGLDGTTGRYYIDVFFYQDLEFLVNGNDGSILKGPTGAASSYLANLISASVAGDIVTIDHPTSVYFGNATPYGGSDNNQFNLLAYASPLATQKKIGFKPADTYRRCIVTIPKCKINPLDINIDGLQVFIDATVCEFVE